MKYNQQFIRDVSFYLKNRNMFSFDGVGEYYNKKGENIIIYDKNGVDGIFSFYQFDSCGKILPTKHPNILKSLLKTKGSINLHIKMFSEDRAKCNMNLIELRAFCIKYKTPHWFKIAVEKQKIKYWNNE